MGRSGYSEGFNDDGSGNLYRATVERALRGKRGQAFLREMLTALDAMPLKELIAGDIVREDGAVCAIGSVAVSRKLDVSQLDESEPDDVALAFGLSRSMVAEIAFVNDDDFGYQKETPAERWQRVRVWVTENLSGLSQIRKETP